MGWEYARLVQKLVNVLDAINEAEKAASGAKDQVTFTKLYEVRRQVDELAHAAMVKGAESK